MRARRFLSQKNCMVLQIKLCLGQDEDERNGQTQLRRLVVNLVGASAL